MAVKEFREFAARGNVVDLAVGVIIGAAFGKIVTSLVNDIVMPPIGMASAASISRICSSRSTASRTRRWPMRRKPARRRSTTASSSIPCSSS